ncbi:terminase [Thalassospira marina]|uniref:Terminase n=1 Tax=Thalassospira marina TaxID=2048283 RepID=A0A2N3KXV2_9PROT|nr:terminase [Thalassospira marina]PKR55411.1 terminase [Thalassospira marina]
MENGLVPNDVADCFTDPRWRLNNLYFITDKEGKRVQFKMNWAQEMLFNELHFLNLVLKARQLGFTTFLQIFMLDACVFHHDTRAGVIAHTLPDAEAIFRDKIKYPYDHLPDGLKDAVPILKNNQTTLELGNNSIVRTGTSLRGGTLQYLHISEFGKICAKYPEKAREIVTGALNTIQAGQVAFIESTAEGQEGRFYDMCQEAQVKKNMAAALSELDWKFHFYPWWKEPAYEIDPSGVVINEEYRKYFAELSEKIGFDLSARKKAWYVKKAEIQQEDMKREYPSTPEEAFEASVEGAYYAKQMARIEAEGRICSLPPLKGIPIHTAWDIGVSDYTTIWFFQATTDGPRIVGYYHDTDYGMPWYVRKLTEYRDRWGCRFGMHKFPHDIKVREWGTGRTRIEQFNEAVSGDETLGTASMVPMHSVADGINAARGLLPRCHFDESECANGLKSLRNYRKDWDEHRSIFRDAPRHDWASHGADGFRGLAMGYKEVPIEQPAITEPKPIETRMPTFAEALALHDEGLEDDY